MKAKDRIKVIRAYDESACRWAKEMNRQIGKTGTIETVIADYGVYIDFEDKNYESAYAFPFESLKLITEAKMSIKDRIEALTGWDKEADDILGDVIKKTNYALVVKYYYDGSGDFLIYEGSLVEKDLMSGYIQPFGFSSASQCSRLRAFKDALLWLAEKAGTIVGKEVKADIEGKIYKVKVIEEC